LMSPGVQESEWWPLNQQMQFPRRWRHREVDYHICLQEIAIRN
jgi:hypothetical protein